MAVIRKQSEVPAASTADLIETYNALTGKSISRFSSRAAGEVQVSNAILSAEDAAGHQGVPKHSKPTAKTVAELAEAKAQEAAVAAASDPPSTDPNNQEADMAAAKKTRGRKTATKKTAAPRKAAAKTKKVKAASAPRQTVYNKVKFTQPDVPRRPQAESLRSKVLEALKARKTATIEQLSADVKFNARSFVHKLVGQGWAEVVPSA